MKRKLYTFIIITAMIITAMMPAQAFGASVATSLSGGGSYTVGATVTVRLTYSGATFGYARARVNYDTSILEYVSSSGTYNTSNRELGMDTLNSSSMSATITFRARAAGSTTVSISTLEGWTDTDPAEAFGGSASTTVTVTAASSSSSSSSGTTTRRPSSNTNGRGDFVDAEEEVEEVDPSIKPEQIEVTVDSKSYVIVEDLEGKDMPEGFEEAKIKYGEYEWEIPVIKSQDSKYTLILLKDNETEEEGWFFYNEETGAITSTQIISLEEALEYEKLQKEANDNSIPIPYVAGMVVAIAASAGLGVLITKQTMIKKKKVKKPEAPVEPKE